jgi:hypothetical protein
MSFKLTENVFIGILSDLREKTYDSEIYLITDSEAFLESVQAGFDEVDDPRAQDNQKYPLISLLVMMLCATLQGLFIKKI